jgi:DNA-binding NarL/FixJ family response regulator
MFPMTTGKKTRVMLVDDHFVVRMGLAGSLDAERDLQVVAECGSGEQAVELYRTHRPDVVVMDWRLPGISGVAATAAIRNQFPEALIVVLSNYDGEDDIYQAVEAGAKAYLPKSVDREELLTAIRRVAGGQTYLPPAIAARLAARQERPQLSPREMEVLRLIVRGASNKQIAKTLGIAEITAKLHVSKLLEKLDASDRTQAATTAIRRGIVHLE